MLSPQIVAPTSDGAVTLDVRVSMLDTSASVALVHGKEVIASAQLAPSEDAVNAWAILQADEYVKKLERKIAQRKRLRGY